MLKRPLNEQELEAILPPEPKKKEATSWKPLWAILFVMILAALIQNC